jgi:hypothetical protein
METPPDRPEIELLAITTPVLGDPPQLSKSSSKSVIAFDFADDTMAVWYDPDRIIWQQAFPQGT